ncbi:hypothetical protein LQ327_20490 [Actinomycetospora endophytica]|uniref:Siderophore synthetase component n=1 Tax=Actinomycetospora endophytica TaxID=2291215 RepID=A0ABS8PC77_9PSEU|nr:IucA/IucC family protein [Actinomycetospora endophytica]MCD2195754.1 hypothetical protein [Actinomycetospora endophytica]
MTDDRQARLATLTRLVNSMLREIGPVPPGPGPVRLREPMSERALVVSLRHHSPSGHHVLDEQVVIDDGDGPRDASQEEAVALLLAIVASAVPDEATERIPARVAALAGQIADSTARTARYLAADPGPEPIDAATRSRQAEQSVRRGHPFHPTPKSLELDGALRGTGYDELERFAPELGVAFRLPYVALDPALTAEALDGPGPWLPADALAAAPSGWPVIPVHPVQLAHLHARTETAGLFADGALVELGERGGEVYPTSSVRTVCDPGFPTAWKLPLHVRITNFVRTVPPEHAVRAQDASRVVRALRGGWTYPGFSVLIETGRRGADPAVVGDDVAADLTVMFRENPIADGVRVLAGLVEEGPRGEEPVLVSEVRASGLDVRDWLHAYLRVSLLPMIDVFAREGVGFEAHLQNSLLITDGGRPVGFRVRDMEGTHVDRDRIPAGLDPASPLVYDGDEAWQRFRYHGVVNQLAGVIGTLGRHLVDERTLWAVVADILGEVVASSGPAAPWARDLRTSPTLPAKANLLSRFAERGESPLYVDLPNPIREADRC